MRTVVQFAVLVFVSALRLLPLSLRQSIGTIAGTILGNLPTRDRAITKLQISRIGLFSGVSPNAVYGHLGRVFLESLNLRPLLTDSARLDSSAITEFWSQRNHQRGLVVLSAHMGNWELLAATATEQKIPVSVIARQARRSSWQSILQNIREKAGVKVIWRADAHGVKNIMTALKKGEVVAALIDQDTDVRSQDSVFFNHSAQTPIGIIELGLRCNADLCVALSYRDHDGCYRFSVSPISVPTTNQVDGIIRQYHAQLEALVRSFPEQWAWVHKRWRTPTGGKRLSSREYLNYLEHML